MAHLRSLALLWRIVVHHLCRPRSRLRVESSTPVVEVYILIQDAKTLVDHERCQDATELRKAASELDDNGSVAIVP